jgi:microcystin-dependent protein
MGGSSANRLTGLSGGVNGDTFGAAGGAETHTLTTAQLASHTHVNVLNDPGHTHTTDASKLAAGAGIASGANFSSGGSTVAAATTGVTITNVAAGSGDAHNNVQPTLILNYIIFAGV